MSETMNIEVSPRQQTGKNANRRSRANGKIATCGKLKPLSVSPLLGEAIRRIHENSSVSSLFV